jgi:hypothetical protein
MKKENATEEIYKVKPWIFLPYEDFDYLTYRMMRKGFSELNDQMFFLGGGLDDYRKCVRIIEKKGFLQNTTTLSHTEYLKKLSQTKIAISFYQSLDRYTTPFDYPGEFCYRDIEYMSIGVPFIRIEYKDSVHDPLIPNFHYISIPRELAYTTYEKEGDEGIANLYIEKYKEVINDEVFLRYISNNQIEWFDRNIISPNIENLTFELLELNKWVDEPNIELYHDTDTEFIKYNNFFNENFPNNPNLFYEFLEFLTTKGLVNDVDLSGKSIDDSPKIIESKDIITLPTLDLVNYKKYTAQQQKDVLIVFKKFLEDIKPSRILEIGTAGGGFTMFLRDTLNEINLKSSPIKSFEINPSPLYEEIRSNDVEINIVNIFDDSYSKLEKPELIEDFIKSEGTTLVLCDGGCKICEFNLLAPLIKSGDFIMAHDYVNNKENFENNFFGKIWNWCEIDEKSIEEVSIKENLVFYNQDNFEKVVWVCKQKK